MSDTLQQKSELKKSCVNCGAELLYAPGTTELKCEYCNHTVTIPNPELGYEELELKKYLSELGSQSHSEEISMLHCKNCGANQHVEENYKSLHCIYCTMPLIVEDMYKEDWITPGAVLPFQIDQKKAFRVFQKWVNKLWFAPTKLKKAALDPQNTKGLYSPYWTFDANLHANYTGQRGEYYYVTKTVGSGNNKKTVTERRTRWYPASGSISGFIDDTLTMASKQRSGIIPRKIARWDLKLLKPFDSSYLAGFVTEKYTIPLKDGHLKAEEVAHDIAVRWAKRDIGGDTQRVSSIDMTLSDETFKHILLPVYISAYKYKGKRYNFFVNGQTGKISGQRPYSFWKIFFFILMIISIIALLIFLVNL
jgi:DNA-directed RNA polymerase subunit RPC12/RpoP